MINSSISKFLDDLASQDSTPGGGSAAAIMGAMSAALVSMVCKLTVGKKNYADVEEDMKATLAKSEDLRARITAMVNDDVQVFNQVMSAYGLPKDSDEQKAHRSAAIQTALKAATDVPLKCARACVEAIELSRIAAEKGNKNVISDAGVAVLAAQAGLRSAALNVYINAGNIKDQDFIQPRLQELEDLLKNAGSETEAIYALVKSKL
jgi:formiminotetrahydrofolate cyclodeaminase